MKRVWWILLFVLIVLIINFFIFFYPGIKKSMVEKKLLETGKEAQAEIISITDTGNRYNSNPEVIITLKVKLAEEETFNTEIRTTLSAVEITKMPEGTIVKVLYNQDNHKQVMIKK
ncbi:hypothetical protein COU61_02385 [Candidatus Pacearchaeota archaeon CG10_big_fil_rev_8_21_14_0_10_35_13]|nr:MAG: hypothetical protein COU61_02385 [Candidatus Pacearchaeota archaeon CG10_big_fil_rev_8_21_14_0_10_35_13]